MSTPTTWVRNHLRHTAREMFDGRAVPGVKVDAGAWPLAGAPGELITEGLDGLASRLVEQAEHGARFATWRAVFTVGERQPSEWALRANAHAIARFARASQDVGIVPVIEPEVRLDGAQSQRDCAGVTAAALLLVSRALADASVDPAATVLSPNMVVPGTRSPSRPTPGDVAVMTIDTLLATVPERVAGIAFLGGGQGSVTANLAAMRSLETPWPLTLSSLLFAGRERERHLTVVR
jgi:fructose-bisphosphate aldolase class I